MLERRNKVYCVYTNESANLTVPGAKGVGVADESFSLSEIHFTNGSVENSLTEAGEAGHSIGLRGDKDGFL